MHYVNLWYMCPPMSVSFLTLVMGIVGLPLVHALVPHHWLPFIIIGKKRKWDQRKVLSVLAMGATVHTISTVAIGLLVGYLGQELTSRIESVHGVVPGLILMAFGSGYFLSGFKHHDFEVSEKVATSTLILMLGISPCVVVAPFFMILGTMGFATVLKVSLLLSVVSVAGMILAGWLALRGLDMMKFKWLEDHEPQIMGSVLMLLGLTFIFV